MPRAIAITLGQGAAAPSGVIASDDFNRADSTSIGSTPVGAKEWAESGNVLENGNPWADAVTLSSNRARLTSQNTATSGFITVDAAATDVDVQVLIAMSAGAGRLAGPVGRYVDVNNYVVLARYSDAGLEMNSVVAGAVTSTADFGFVLTASTTMRLTVIGTTATAYINGTLWRTLTVPAAAGGATRAGVLFRDNSFGCFADDFSVSAA